jgi:hypothetical protein
VLAFLLTNLENTAEVTVRFRLPLNILGTSINLPFARGAHVGGARRCSSRARRASACARPSSTSACGDDGAHKYINGKNLLIAEQLFSNMRLETLDAGHWDRSPARPSSPDYH